MKTKRKIISATEEMLTLSQFL